MTLCICVIQCSGVVHPIVVDSSSICHSITVRCQLAKTKTKMHSYVDNISNLTDSTVVHTVTLADRFQRALQVQVKNVCMNISDIISCDMYACREVLSYNIYVS